MNSYYDAFNGTKEIIQFAEEWYGDRAERWNAEFIDRGFFNYRMIANAIYSNNNKCIMK